MAHYKSMTMRLFFSAQTYLEAGASLKDVAQMSVFPRDVDAKTLVKSSERLLGTQGDNVQRYGQD